MSVRKITRSRKAWLALLMVVASLYIDKVSLQNASTSGDSTGVNPFAGQTIYVDPYSNAKKTADSWRSSRPSDAAQMDKIAKTGTSRWIAEHHSDPQAATNEWVTAATNAKQLPIIATYMIPGRDCGAWSEGGLAASEYQAYIDKVAAGIGSRKAIVVIEPDALADLNRCGDAAFQQERVDLLKYSVTKFKASANTYVYIDAGNNAWQSAQTMIDRLKLVGIDKADGFALNTGGAYETTSNSIAYGKQISAGVANKPFVVDTSRNGDGPYTGGVSGDCQPWFNPPGRALGERAGSATNDPLVHAYTWVKPPGESDGACGSFPPAGQWMPEYALELAKNAKW